VGVRVVVIGELLQELLQVKQICKQAVLNEVTDTSKRNALKLATNWVNPNDAGDKMFYKMTLNLPTGQLEHDYYIGIDVSTNTAYRYIYEKIDSVLSWIRIPLQISISGL
jgi:hypothetical protein